MHTSLFPALVLFSAFATLVSAQSALPPDAPPGSRTLQPSLYFQVGIARFHQGQGTFDTPAYSFGADLPVAKGMGIDLGFIDFGTARTPNFPSYTFMQVKPDHGQSSRRRAGFLLPTLSFSPVKRLTVALGLGPSLVSTQIRSYETHNRWPQLVGFARDENRTELLFKLRLKYALSANWQMNLAGTAVKSPGYSRSLTLRNDKTMLVTDAWMLGFSFTPDPVSHRAWGEPWRLAVAPVLSWLSFHENYHTTPTGQDIQVQRKIGDWMIVSFGHTELGVSKRLPRKADGSLFVSPPFDGPDDPESGFVGVPERGKLQISAGTAYCLVGVERSLSTRVQASLAVGAGWTTANFNGIGPVALHTQDAISDSRSSWSPLVEGRLALKLGGNWELGLGVRHMEFNGVQFTFHEFEPDYPDTKVRVWSLVPQLSLRF